jgi:uncharacterized protein YqgC (DUF456 family)
VIWTLGVVGFVLAELAALAMIPLGLPGTWLQVAIAGVLAWFHPDAASRVFVIAIVLAVAGEVTDVVSGRWGTRRFGGSSRAAWGALLGGFAGLFIGTPIPVVGSLVMSFVGTFVGAVAGELWGRGDLAPSLRSGWGAVVGRAVGVGVKMALAFTIAIASTVALLRAADG